MLKTYFNNIQLVLIFISTGFFVISIIYQLKDKYNYAVIFLFIGAITLYLFSALLDPFLNIWDERFHALVAKNLMNHPLRPTLYDNPIVNMNYNRWDRSIIWLHKQPLFLWQIAISFKLFGISEFSLRLPSAILSGFLVIFSYRTGKLLVNKRVGFYTALLFATSFNLVELVSGRVVSDHNDVAFLFYTTASIWAWSEYIFSKRKYWLYLIGIFSGFAVLCKWLTGLLIYFGWFIYSFYSNKFEIKKNGDFFFSFMITLIVVLPWQIFIFYKYPKQAIYELNYNSLHFTKVLEGLPKRGMWFYLDNITVLYGKVVPYILLLGFILLYRKIQKKKIKVAFISMPLFVYVFFTFAKTKMPNYTFVVTLPIYLSLACLIEYIIIKINCIRLPKVFIHIITFLFLIFLSFENLNIEKIQEKHTLWKKDNKYTRRLLHNKKIFQSLMLPNNAVLFNVKGRHYIEAMFYTGKPSYNFIPSFKQYKELKTKGKTIEIFASKHTVIPDYLRNDSTVIIINKKLEGYK